MSLCKICNNDLETVISFGEMPISNRFVSDVTADEFLYDLSLGFCPECFMVQLEECVGPAMMFNEDYAYFSSISKAMEGHFGEMAKEIMDVVSDKPQPFVVELGCNDGIMLKHVAERGIPHLGVEPSANVAARAREKGVHVLEDFFNATSASEIKNRYGKADVICGANVMCHIEDINSVFEGVSVLLKPDGVFFFEDPYLADIIKKASFDQVYDEHVYYFSGLAVSELAKRHGLQLVNMVPHEVHGGSMRYYLSKGSKNRVTKNVEIFLAAEKTLNLHVLDGYILFRERVDKICSDFKQALLRIKAEGKKIAAYGATSKSTTLLIYSKVGPDLIDYVSDTTPTKIGKYTPGTHIPVKSHGHFIRDSPPYTVLLAWNHKREIFEKEKKYREKGGKFITFFPEVIIE
ncbi:MAG: class I SAM-dependent methyltransferase [Deltaproteobacteria bacterium]|nr:class I SAM-dependent methyltransferase [Deltaproteobacteria bacterium]